MQYTDYSGNYVSKYSSFRKLCLLYLSLLTLIDRKITSGTCFENQFTYNLFKKLKLYNYDTRKIKQETV